MVNVSDPSPWSIGENSSTSAVSARSPCCSHLRPGPSSFDEGVRYASRASGVFRSYVPPNQPLRRIEHGMHVFLLKAIVMPFGANETVSPSSA